jgi:hypothetical protein
MAASFFSGGELRLMELELAILKRKKALAESQTLKLQPVQEDEPEQGSWHLLSGLSQIECNMSLAADDARSETSTNINSDASDIDTISVITSGSELSCKYYTTKGTVFFDLQGNEQTYFQIVLRL